MSVKRGLIELVISSNKGFVSQNWKAVGLLAGKCDFFFPSGLTLKAILIWKTSKIKLYCVIALNRFMNKRNEIHG